VLTAEHECIRQQAEVHVVVYLALRECRVLGQQPGLQRLLHPLQLAKVAGQLVLEPAGPLDAGRGEIGDPFQHQEEVFRVVDSLAPW
jgi:hypothetical protein